MKLAYYPGCSLDSSAVEYNISTKRTAELLGTELIEIDDWNCCGATSAHNTDKLLSLALPARNLAIAEKTGLDILAPCAACYNRFRAAEHAVRADSAVREKIQEIIEMEYSAANSTFSILEFLVDKVGLDKIKEKITRPLKGMKAACYYGCLLVRPVEHTGFDDPEDPQTMDKIAQTLGAETVDWAYKTECCGAALATSRPDIGNRMIYEVIQNAREAGAECIITACPLCMMNLDMRQAGAEREFSVKFNLPVYYITELVALACGDSPEAIGVNKHFVEAVSYLKTLPAKAAEMEAEKPQKATKSTAPASEEDKEALQKKINAFIKGFENNPEKMASMLLDDEEKTKILVEIVNADKKKTNKLAELMAADKDKAAKAAEAYVAGEIKKRAKTAGNS